MDSEMTSGNKEYEIAKKATKRAGCGLPESHIFHSTVANTYAFIREYFYQKGWDDAKKSSEDKK